MPRDTALPIQHACEGAWQAHELPAAIASEFGHHFLLALPEGYSADPQRAWPLVVFLHGRGEWGDDLARVRSQGVGALIDGGVKLPAIVVAPQTPENQMWQPAFVDAVMRCVQANCRVDASRVYLTGLSMGAMGSLALAATFPDRFAAIAPIAGGFPNDGMSRFYNVPLGALDAWQAALAALRGVPVWVAHGDADDIVPIEFSQRVESVLQAVGADVRCVWMPGVGHDSWTATYRDTPEFWRWLFAQQRTDASRSATADAAAWAGRYRGEGGVSGELTAEGDRLRVRWQPSGIGDLLLPAQGDCFVGTMLLRFSRDAHGRVVELPGLGALRDVAT
ncbi:alpha/beta hydrolase-fold protein [Niveibacterium sp.]|uniref:carboxylesterase family protein n=1 Tax=Niveibacterium sp. TaxID=2017444 RepID=UPI0035B0BBDD